MKKWIYVLFLPYCFLFSELFFTYVRPAKLLPIWKIEGNYGVARHIPNVSYSHWLSPNYQVHFRFNSLGLRSDEEFTYEKPADVTRVVVLGDSLAMGWDVDIKDLFLTQAKQTLASYGKKVEFINFSLAGFSDSEEFLVLQNEGVLFHPDMVLLVYTHRNPDESGLFEIKNNKLQRKNIEYIHWRPKFQLFLLKIPGYKWLSSNSHTWYYFKNLVLGMREDIISMQNAASEEINTNKNEQGPELTIKIMEEMNHFCLSKNIQFFVLDVPLPENGQRTLYFPKKELPQIPVIDPEKLFSEAKKPVYSELIGTNHLTAYGHSLLADCVVDFMLQNSKKMKDENTR